MDKTTSDSEPSETNPWNTFNITLSRAQLLLLQQAVSFSISNHYDGQVPASELVALAEMNKIIIDTLNIYGTKAFLNAIYGKDE